MARARESVPRILIPLVILGTVALVVAILGLAEEVLLPVAFAFILAFVLTPLVKALERAGLPRGGAVALTMLALLSALVGFGVVLSNQFSDLSQQLTQYSSSMRQKVAALRGHSSAIDALQRTVSKVTEELDQTAETTQEAAPVRVVPDDGSAIDRLERRIAPVVAPLGRVIVVLVLVGFMLGRREDLRDRFIRLVGPDNVTLTTRALDEAAQRVSRYLLTLSMVNLGYGTIVALGLLAIGVPYAALWGFLAALLRFIPYIGSSIALVMPALIAFAKFPGWAQVLETVALYLGTDALSAYLLEPMLIGHRTGVSSLALLTSLLFWTWLWGPLGLVLATPLTLCLAVMGRQVPQLRFLDVLLGDKPALDTEVSFYQRLLARDEDEAAEIIERQRAALGPAAAMDQVLVPALGFLAHDLGRGEINAEQGTFVHSAMDDIVQQLAPEPEPGARGPSADAPSRVFGVPARGTLDALVLKMLATLTEHSTERIEPLAAPTAPVSDLLAQIDRRTPMVLCIAALPPTGSAPARYLCQRVRERYPDLPILVLRPNPTGGDSVAAAERLRKAGATQVATSIEQARKLLASMLSSAKPRVAVEAERSAG